jgi:hypothetical protein
LVDEDIAIREIKDALLLFCLPQSPDNLESSIGLPGSGCHNQKDAVPALGNCFDGPVDGDTLVVTRLLAASILEVVLEDNVIC